MAAIFTPGLKIREEIMLQKERRLPMEGEVLVAVGDQVEASQVVARTELPGKVYPVNIANQLGVDPGRLAECLLKQVGDRVTAGEVVARTAGFFGLFGSEATALVSGTIETISSVTGQIIYQEDPIPVEVKGYISGKVVEVIPDEGCLIQSRATLVQGIFGLSGERRGRLVMGVQAPTEVLQPEHLTAEMAGCIVVGGSYLTLETLRKAQSIGLAGLVTGGFDYDDIKELLGYEVGVAITGGEALGLTLLVTEGFGSIQMAPGTFELLRSREGQTASINGATQIRAGVIRPEVVVTFDDEDLPDVKAPPEEPVGIAIGDLIRGIRTPHFGRLGTVVGLPVEPLALDTESLARVMEVDFDGERVLLPRANVERIER